MKSARSSKVSLRQSEARYRRLASVDGLTGLANRRAFDERLQDEWGRALVANQPLSLLMIDVDLFKKYNDLFGHINGDNCLRQIANIIADSVPPSLGEASRFGGEEFAVILPNTDSARAMAAAESLRAAVAAIELPHPGSPWHLQTISIGGAVAVPETGQSPVSLLNASDSALYLAKLLGHSRVRSNLSPLHPSRSNPGNPSCPPSPQASPLLPTIRHLAFRIAWPCSAWPPAFLSVIPVGRSASSFVLAVASSSCDLGRSAAFTSHWHLTLAPHAGAGNNQVPQGFSLGSHNHRSEGAFHSAEGRREAEGATTNLPSFARANPS